MKNNIFLEQPRRGYTREAQLTPYKAGGRSVGMITVILLVLSVLATACNKPEMHNLEGTWQWTRTSGGIAGVNYTPENEGFEAEIVFKGNRFTFYKDGKKVTSGTYSIDYIEDEPLINKGGADKSFYSNFRFHISIAQIEKISKATNGKISFFMDPRGVIGNISNSGADGQVLHLCDDACDGFCSTFVKK